MWGLIFFFQYAQIESIIFFFFFILRTTRNNLYPLRLYTFNKYTRARSYTYVNVPYGMTGGCDRYLVFMRSTPHEPTNVVGSSISACIITRPHRTDRSGIGIWKTPNNKDTPKTYAETTTSLLLATI